MGVEDVATCAARASARWIGHVARMNAERFPLQVLFGAAADRGPSLNDVGHRLLRTGMAGATPFEASWLSGRLGPPPLAPAASLLGMLPVCPDT